MYKKHSEYNDDLKATIDAEVKTKHNKKIFYELFLKFFDVRILPRHDFESHKKKVSTEEYIKDYINHTATRLKVDNLVLTNQESSIKWDLEDIDLQTIDGKKIKACFIKSWVKHKRYNQRWFIVVHGLNSHKFRAIFYGLMYLRWGYNVAVLDLRNHGSSDKTTTTLGSKEKFDLKAVTDYLMQHYTPKEINFHGWSMGTFTIVEYLKDNNYNKKLNRYVILDSTVDRIENLWKYMINDYLKISAFTNFNNLREYTIKTRDYDPSKINPGEDLAPFKKIKFLYIVNNRDWATPCKLGLSAFNHKIASEKRPRSQILELDLEHARGIYEENTKYTEVVKKFITRKKWGFKNEQ